VISRLASWLRRRRNLPDSDDALLSEADRVWNRACDYDFQPSLSGDRALKQAISFDGLTNNGGLAHSLDVVSNDDARAAIAAFRHFGLAETAGLIERALTLPDEGEREALTERYDALTETLLQAAFEQHYREHPDEYEQLR
jgi:hypothetical protein